MWNWTANDRNLKRQICWKINSTDSFRQQSPIFTAYATALTVSKKNQRHTYLHNQNQDLIYNPGVKTYARFCFLLYKIQKEWTKRNPKGTSSNFCVLYGFWPNCAKKPSKKPLLTKGGNTTLDSFIPFLIIRYTLFQDFISEI